MPETDALEATFLKSSPSGSLTAVRIGQERHQEGGFLEGQRPRRLPEIAR